MSWQLVKVTGSTLCNPDGTVLSLSPNGPTAPTGYTWATPRPPGTSGPFEQAAIDGGIVAYNPLGTEAVLFRFKQTVPNTDGLSAIDNARID